MSTLEYNGKKVLVDENGYLENQEDWDKEVAVALAFREGFDSLTREQIAVIRFTREYFLKYKVFPIVNNDRRITPGPESGVSELFMNPEKAWKIAGLPKRNDFHFVSMDDEHYLLDLHC